ncbi:hypothetical protein GDO78_020994 [Eleutherodactylus coqui]|uniref:Uncharacterized protein n=1 Tax=Eleutherodactylus coqui TaxID=57060 RepID=A0A8J6E5E7_ELECQ|nr:hypothetical protein GDO78_020994 [Eleutherodactylus coqui]
MPMPVSVLHPHTLDGSRTGDHMLTDASCANRVKLAVMASVLLALHCAFLQCVTSEIVADFGAESRQNPQWIFCCKKPKPSPMDVPVISRAQCDDQGRG